MLSSSQIKYICRLSGLTPFCEGDQVLYVRDTNKNQWCTDFSRVIQAPYEDFKLGMKLGDIKFSWLLGRGNFIAGGAVLSWVLGNNLNEDVDFFFRSHDMRFSFLSLLSDSGVVNTGSSTNYAQTLFDPETGYILQAVGSEHSDKFLGSPEETISRFDIGVCRFAVTSESVYFTLGAAIDLIRLNCELDNTDNPMWVKQRVLKYIRKGFYPGNTIFENIEIKGGSNVQYER